MCSEQASKPGKVGNSVSGNCEKVSNVSRFHLVLEHIDACTGVDEVILPYKNTFTRSKQLRKSFRSTKISITDTACITVNALHLDNHRRLYRETSQLQCRYSYGNFAYIYQCSEIDGETWKTPYHVSQAF